jgi:hypothetical protein
MLSNSKAKLRRTDVVTLDADGPAFNPVLQLAEFQLEGVSYVRKETVQLKHRERNKTSAIWRFGEALIRQSDCKEVYYCYLCEHKKSRQALPILCGNKGGLNHMATHGIDKEGNQIEKRAAGQQVIMNLVAKTDFNEFKRLFVRWVIYCHIALLMIENEYFRELLRCLNAALSNLLPAARSTVRGWIIDEFEEQKDCIRKELESALTDIHLSFDLWQSPNYYSIISIFGHWIGSEGKRKTALLAFRRLQGLHSGENQAAIILQVVRDYQISHKIGHFMADNASSNDTCVETVLKELYPQMSAKQCSSRRLRCFGHVTNLCARALLLGKSAGKDIDEVELKERRGAFEAVEMFWRQRGAVGRLHNIVRYIRWVPQRREEFASIHIGGKLAEFDDLEGRYSRALKAFC